MQVGHRRIGRLIPLTGINAQQEKIAPFLSIANPETSLSMTDQDLVEFLKWCLPEMRLRWPGFRKVRRTVRKRLNRRMRDIGLSSLAGYRQRLENDPAEWAVLDEICRIPISRLYRDRHVYDTLSGQILPDCADAARKRGRDRIRILSAGCASGEEPYTLSLVWSLRVADRHPECTIDILALDIDEGMLARAEAACYPPGALKDMPAEIVELGFNPADGEYCLRPEFRQCITFKKHDLRNSVPAGPFDLILCRNTAFTYFDRATQAAVLEQIAAALRTGGYLVVGAHETLPGEPRCFQRLSPGLPIFRKVEEIQARPAVARPASPANRLVLDGSYGEGGGQILRSALGLSAMTGRPIRIESVRAKRKRPGLAAQHLTSVRAIAEICEARVEGDELQSTVVDFEPRRPVKPGSYIFDVSATSQGRSAGSAPLILQAVLVPLALSGGRSHVSVHGGTHVPWSPSFDYLRDVWLPILERIGISATVELDEWGWFPIGGGRIDCTISAAARPLCPLRLLEPGPLVQVSGRAVAGRLPEHIAVRMAGEASAILKEAGIESSIEAMAIDSPGTGAGIFLTARYANLCGGFAELGKRGKPAEAVAAEAAEKLLAHHRSSAAVENHLADQLVLPLSLAGGISEYTVERVTTHLETHAWLVQKFGLAEVAIEQLENGAGLIRILPKDS